MCAHKVLFISFLASEGDNVESHMIQTMLALPFGSIYVQFITSVDSCFSFLQHLHSLALTVVIFCLFPSPSQICTCCWVKYGLCRKCDSVAQILIGVARTGLQLFVLLKNIFMLFLNITSMIGSQALVFLTGWNWRDGFLVDSLACEGLYSASISLRFAPKNRYAWSGKIISLHAASTNYNHKIMCNTIGLLGWNNRGKKNDSFLFWVKKRRGERAIQGGGFTFARSTRWLPPAEQRYER